MFIGTLMAKIGADVSPLRQAVVESKSLLGQMSHDVSMWGLKFSASVSTPLTLFGKGAVAAQSAAEATERSFVGAFQAAEVAAAKVRAPVITPVIKAPSIPAVKVPVQVQTPAVKAPSIPAVKVPVQAPSIPTVKVPVQVQTPAVKAPSIPTVKVPVQVQTPAIKTPVITPVIKAPSIPTVKVPVQVQTPAIKTPVITPVIKAPSIPAVKVPVELQVGGAEWAARDMVARLQGSTGLGSSTLMGMSGQAGRLLAGMGIDPRERVRLSEQIVGMGLDLASFSGQAANAEQAIRAMSYAMMGSGMALRRFGIMIRDSEVAEAMAAKGAKNLTGEQAVQARSLAMLEVLQRKLSVAQGAWSRDETYAKRLFILRDRMMDFREASGKMIIDGLQLGRVMDWLSDRMGKLNIALERLGPTAKTVFVVGGLSAVALGPALLMFGQFISGVMALVAYLPTIVAFGAAVGAVGFAVWRLGEAWGWWGRTAKAVNAALKGDLSDLIKLMAGAVVSIGRAVEAPLNYAHALAQSFAEAVDVTAVTLMEVLDTMEGSWKSFVTWLGTTLLEGVDVALVKMEGKFTRWFARLPEPVALLLGAGVGFAAGGPAGAAGGLAAAELVRITGRRQEEREQQAPVVAAQLRGMGLPEQAIARLVGESTRYANVSFGQALTWKLDSRLKDVLGVDRVRQLSQYLQDQFTNIFQEAEGGGGLGTRLREWASRFAEDLTRAAEPRPGDGVTGGQKAEAQAPAPIEAQARQYAAAAQRGSVEAYRMEIARTDTYQTKSIDLLSRIAASTEDTADGLNGLGVAEGF